MSPDAPTPIDAQPDHVAIAVPDYRPALARWRDQLGGAQVSRFHNKPVFRGMQLRYANGAKIELLQPSELDESPDNFLRRFLTRFGSQVHHVTLKVPDLAVAIERLRDAGMDVIDVNLSGEHWHESFLRPSQVGGLVVQVAWSSGTDEEWAARRGIEIEPVRADAASLHGPVLRHPDLDAAAQVWSLLGATVAREEDSLLARWADAPLEVSVIHGDTPGPVGLRFSGTDRFPPDDRLGPAVLPYEP
ncbi:MAG: VOC family protein [Nitriliruptorales bacterium]|nr:VOC family protein [Nitriliruptorales bacterium]